MPAVVAQIDGWDPVARAAVTITAASHDDVTVCQLGGTTWWPALVKLPTLRYDLFDGAFAGKITAPSSSLTMRTEPWPDFGRYSLAAARIRLWVGEVGAAWETYTLRFDGRLSGQPAIVDGLASIDFAVDDSWLDTALLATYAGTTGAEGPAALKGQAKPLALGRPRYVPGVLIDSVNSVFQVSNGPVAAIEAALEKLARFGNPVADYATYDQLVAATIAPGAWATARAVGMARFGAPPTGQVSFLVSGDNVAGWVRLPGAVIRRLATIAGAAGRIADATLTALDGARPYPVSIYLEQQTTAREIIQAIAASVNAVVGVSWTGQLFALPVAIGAAAMTLAADGSQLPPVEKVEQVEIATPWQKLTLAAERAWSVHALADIAFTATLIDRGRYSPTETYREGNIVDLADGSRWAFIATTPAKGLAPQPGSPVWSNINPATKAGDIAYADGKSLEAWKPATPGATAGAPAGTTIGGTINDDGTVTGGRSVDDLLADLDVNVLSLAEELVRGAASRALIDFRTLLSDRTTPIATFVEQAAEQQKTDTEAFAQLISLIGAKAPGGEAFQLNLQTAMVGPEQSLASYMSDISAEFNGQRASIETLNEVYIDPTGATARSLNVTDVDGNITGTYNTNNGRVGEYIIVADIFKLIRRNGGQPMQVFGYGLDGVPEMPNVRVGNLAANSVTIANVAPGLSTARRFTNSDVAINAGEVTLCETPLFDVGDGSAAGNALATISFEHDGTARVDTAASIRIYLDVNDGNGYVKQGTTRRSGIQVQSGDAKWVITFNMNLPITALGKARVKVTGQGLSIGGGPTSGSTARAITVDVLRVGR